MILFPSWHRLILVATVRSNAGSKRDRHKEFIVIKVVNQDLGEMFEPMSLTPPASGCVVHIAPPTRADTLETA
jgi:hypothetical protein